MTRAVELSALIWWGCAMALLGASVLASICFPWPWRAPARPAPHPPLTAVIPVKTLDPDFDAAQDSLFAQAYPGMEILIGSAEADSPALDAVRAIQARHPQVPSRVVDTSVRRAVSPKLNNVWAPIEQAGADLILTKDSNLSLAPGDLDNLLAHFGDGVGLVSAIPVLVGPRSPAAWIETAFINGYYARMLMLARAAGLGFGLGKVMLFKRSDLGRAGGLQAVAWALGEDSAMTEAVARMGLRTVLTDRLVRQVIGARPWPDLWNRLLRWKLIWRVQRPLLFLGSLFGSALLAAAAAALAAPLAGVGPGLAATVTLVGWFLAECLISAARGWPLSAWSPLAFLGREIFDLIVWAAALTTSEVAWAGGRYRSEKPGRSALAAGRGPQ